jgi:hypothetical protein
VKPQRPEAIWPETVRDKFIFAPKVVAVNGKKLHTCYPYKIGDLCDDNCGCDNDSDYDHNHMTDEMFETMSDKNGSY